jgi:hypothetical protein
MAAPRYLCSHLVRLFVDGHEQWVNLEEIWEGGAVLECEEAVTAGAFAKVLAEEAVFAGRIKAAEAHEFGWRVEIEFSPLTQWTIERWKPEHALDPAKLRAN